MDFDWRLAGNEELFRGAVFVQKRYSRWNPEWDHDHCSFCKEQFVEEGSETDQPGAHQDGFSTPGPPRAPREDYYWVCARCFADFRDHLGWTVRPVEDGSA